MRGIVLEICIDFLPLKEGQIKKKQIFSDISLSQNGLFCYSVPHESLSGILEKVSS